MIPLGVAAAGGLGAAARFMLDGALTVRLPRTLPTATLAINVLGSFLLGAVTGWAAGGAEGAMRGVLGVGFLGGFTTFSTASVEVVRLVRARRPAAAVGLALAMLALSLGAAVLGLAVGSWMG